ncbi:DUF397 domain-containing protein [Amycolatopsis sp. NPDC058340]|uniref:DUF397 domain-containing protein n=1 Tax=Amycolatopsis sp. NPDC058340 TaxID=3346453 RepID=UPI0036596697
MNDAEFSSTTKAPGGWFKSSYSNATASCVEVQLRNDSISVRDSKDRTANPPTIKFSPESWNAFLSSLK